MSRWTVRILGIIVLLVLFLMMFQMLNTLKRMAASQEHGDGYGVRWPQPPLSHVTAMRNVPKRQLRLPHSIS
jgi:hypothetical protein